MECSKENKKHFFRKGGHSQPCPPGQGQGQGHPQHQQSISYGSSRSHQQPHQRSFDMISAAPSITSSSSSTSRAGGGTRNLQHANIEFDAKQLQALQNLQNLQALQNLQNLQISGRIAQQQLLQQQQLHQKQQQLLQQQQLSKHGVVQHGNKSAISRVGATSGASGSLDEAEINMNAHRRYMLAPRRARSAERFDGMRVQLQHQQSGSGSGSGELASFLANPNTMGRSSVSNSSQGGEEIRSYRSPALRQLDNTSLPSSAAGSPLNPGGTNNGMSGPVNVTQQPPPSNAPGVRRPIPIVGVPGGIIGVKSNLDSGYPSPPPSYTTATASYTTGGNEARDPPPYHQAIASGGIKHPQALGRPGVKGSSSSGLVGNNRYATMGGHGHTHSSGSHSLSSTPTGNQGIRSVASTPIFPNIDNSCGCHKCQLQGRTHEGDYNDAVYMESQAFLMHEIMTDGMAFCSIV
ncbi:PIN+ prion protein RNQ1-like [Folsomia candida]|uniref:PIN+ prion protein RNQ1-like n=1 Tax=Folsomia candida TaxID=158441 RepID=UPI001604A48E|nr:PIN+ prion protein RNQ1-like [Folsomia candida]